MKGNKGITLIALVITIIVLLILAGISIAMLAGNNSILNRSAQARVANALGAGKDKVNMCVMAAMQDYYQGVYDVPNGAATGTSFQSGEMDKYIASVVNASPASTDYSTGYFNNAKANDYKLETTDVTFGAWSAKATNGTIQLTYKPDGSTVVGHLSNGVVTWDPIHYNGQNPS